MKIKSEKQEEKSEISDNNLSSNKDIGESRRIFLKKLWSGLGIIASIEFITVIFGFLFSGKNVEEKYTPKKLYDAGSVSSFQKNSVTPFRGGRFYIARLDDGGFIALSLRCTHLGCSINWEEKEQRFVCPCHSSSFDINGDVLSPPAPRALDYYRIIIENNEVKVDIGSRLERSKFHKEQVVYV